ncbi:MAG: hypothetical protein JWR07_4122 [Nevskia sp.]|nr:hypothetical protein [Nevskia sp.]
MWLKPTYRRLTRDFPGATWEAIATGMLSQVEGFRAGLAELD